MKTICAMLALLIGSFPVWADGDENIESKPGYVDFGVLAADYGEPRVMVDISESLLKLVSALKHDDPVAEAALQDLESVRVHVYDTAGDIAAATEHMHEISDLLSGLDWEQTIKVRDTDKKVNVYVKHGEDKIHGLTVMKVDGEEAVFVNVLGDIKPSELSLVMDRINMDVDL